MAFVHHLAGIDKARARRALRDLTRGVGVPANEAGASMTGVAGWFETRGEVPLVRPAGLRDYGPLADDPDRPEENFSESSIRGVAFAMEYCDSRGWMSTRTIRCLGLDPRAPACIRAFCSVRETTRTFRIDRIISILNLRSGRILPGEAHVELLTPYLAPADSAGPHSPMVEVHRIARNGVFALLHLAMPQGVLGDKARRIVLDYIEAEAGELGCPLPAADSLELWIDNLAPPMEAVVQSVDELLAEKDKFVRLLPWLLKVVRTQHDFAVQEEAVRQLIAEVRLHFRRKLLDWPADRRAAQL